MYGTRAKPKAALRLMRPGAKSTGSVILRPPPGTPRSSKACIRNLNHERLCHVAGALTTIIGAYSPRRRAAGVREHLISLLREFVIELAVELWIELPAKIVGLHLGGQGVPSGSGLDRV